MYCIAARLPGWKFALAATLAAGGSLAAQDNAGWRYWGAEDGLPESYVSAVAVDPAGTVRMVHGTSGMSRTDGYTVDRNIPALQYARTLLWMADGLWAFDVTGLQRLRGHAWEFHPLDALKGFDPLFGPRLKVMGQGRLLAVQDDGLVMYDPATRQSARVLDAARTGLGVLSDAAPAPDGRVLVSGAKGVALCTVEGSPPRFRCRECGTAQLGLANFHDVQADGAGVVAEVAKAAGVASLTHVSALGAGAAGASRYARSKAAGEDAIRSAFPEAVVFRPSALFGTDDTFLNRFAALATMMPVLPLIGGGKTKFQPVYVVDVAEAIAVAIEGGATPGAIYELGGPRVMSLREIFQFVLAETERKRLLVPIPFALAKLKASFLQLLPNPLLTVDQVTLLKSDSVVSDEAKAAGLTLSGLGITPHAVEAIAPSYLWSYRPRGQYDRHPA